MRTVTIPNDYNPFRLEVNGRIYSYKAGTTQSVPDDVAEAIDVYKRQRKPAKPNSIIDNLGLSFEKSDAGHALMVNNEGTDLVWQEPVANLDAAIELAQEAKADAEDAQEAAESAADRAESAAETLELDATLTSATKAAQAKAVGDAIANITIDVDDTLTQQGEAADAKAVGDAVGDLTTKLYESYNGKMYINGTFSYGIFENNFPVSDPRKFNAVTMTAEKYNREITIEAKTGYNFLAYWYNDSDVYVGKSANWETTRTIPANTNFRLWVRPNPLDTSIVLDLDTVKENIIFNTPIQDDVDANANGVQSVKQNIEAVSKGIKYLDTKFVWGRMNASTGAVEVDSAYKYQVVMPSFVTYDTDVVLDCNAGYRYQVWWYTDEDAYISRTGSFKTAGQKYTVTAGTNFRLFVTLDPASTSANVPPDTFAKNVYIVTEIQDEIDTIKTLPLTTFPEYIINNLSNKHLGELSKGYILLSFDDGANALATGTIPLLISNNVPATFGLLPQSEIFATGNESELATVVDAVENHGCVVAMHGSAQWPTYTESDLYDYFNDTVSFFADNDLGETYGAICPGGPGADTSVLVKAVAGGYFGYVFSGNRADKISYDTIGYSGKYNGARSNRFDLDRISGVGITTDAHNIVTYAAENHLLLCPFWHDNTLNDSSHTEYVTYFNNLITEAKSAGLTFITTKDLPNII